MLDILIMVLDHSEDDAVLAAAHALEDEHGATASALLFARRTVAQSAVEAGVWVLAPPQPVPSEACEISSFGRRFARFGRVPSIRRIEVNDGAAADRPGVEARRATLTLMLRPAGARDETLRRSMFESVLYESGRPVVLVPRGWSETGLGRTILVAWDGSREATRAVADAAFLFPKAESVVFLTVETGSRCGPVGREMARSIRRGGVRCHVRSVSDARQSVDYLLIREALALGADLIVMGGYGHARVHEMIFGGVTRAMVRSSPVPLFISR